MQGGIHPDYTLEHYGRWLSLAKEVAPQLHLHAYSPMEIHFMCERSGKSPDAVFEYLRECGLGSTPGTAAEVLDDGVRQRISPNKLPAARWVEIIEAAHRSGLRSTSTVMFGHIEEPRELARHMRVIRALQERTGGITEFVPLSFIPFQTLLGRTHGIEEISAEENLKHTAAFRLALGKTITNLQASWVKMGLDAATESLRWGVNDLGGTLMEENISRMAGSHHGDPPRARGPDRRRPRRRPDPRAAHDALRDRRDVLADPVRAMVLDRPGGRLAERELAAPEPGPGEVVVRVHACGVCRTDLHVVDGDLPRPKLPLVLGHQVAGEVVASGEASERFAEGDRVGVPWLGWACGECRYCREGRENLCERAQFTGYQLDGGYAELTVADERFCLPLPAQYGDAEVAPLLCAGLIGYRALRACGDPATVGLYGFGASAHIVCQLAAHEGRRVFALTRPGDREGQAFALELGAEWAGRLGEGPARSRSTPRSCSPRWAPWCRSRFAPSARAGPWSARGST